MPSGCDFICKNEKCEHKEKGFVFKAPWPLGDIDKILADDKVHKMEQLRVGLEKLREEGRGCTCINYPNQNKIPTVGYRYSSWCNDTNVLWSFGVILEEGDEEKTPEELSSKPSVKKTDDNGNELWDFEKTLEHGVKCPSCGEKMFQSRWFSKEVVKRDKRNEEE